MVIWIDKTHVTIKEKEGINNYISLDQVRKKHRNKILNEHNDNLAIALKYTKTIFAPYISDNGLDNLCQYISMYAEGLEIKILQPVQVDKPITSVDIYHYGWSIWHHFKVTDQWRMAVLLKTVFCEILDDVDSIETIKKKMKI